MSLITFLTEDDKVMTVDERITKFSELFNTLHQNFETESGKPLTGIKESDINLLITFCEACNYTKIKYKTPLWKKPFQIHYDEIIGNNEKLIEFYDELTLDKLLKYIKLSYFYDSNPLKDFCYFKLYDIFNDEKKCKEYFKDKDKKGIEAVLKIDDEKKNYLYNEYNNFIEKQVNSFSDEEIENYVLQHFP